MPDRLEKEFEGSCDYHYEGNTDSIDHLYTVPAVLRELKDGGKAKRVFDLGCGNGVVANKLATNGYDVTGIDASTTGIENAQRHYPNLRLELGSVYDDLAAKYGQFPYIVCLEVVEHLFYPRTWAKTVFDLTEPDGWAIISTPYHGYWKNLAMAVTGKLDRHFSVLWDCGHIKFFSIETLTQLLEEAGFRQVRFRRLGRIPPLAKSMLAIATKPKTSG
jgi:2-polyprenyl-3-methyl-5-hydroxy-6-metoxy-1,4-benzoquinol methylase